MFYLMTKVTCFLLLLKATANINQINAKVQMYLSLLFLYFVENITFPRLIL